LPDASPAVATHELRKEYGRGRVAVEGASLIVETGEVFGFLGANGAGKTTFVKMLLGLVRPTSGAATIFGWPVQNPAARRMAGYQPEQFRFPDWMTGTEALTFHATLGGVRPDARTRAVSDALERVGLGDRGADRIGTYSKGMQQRLALAQALVAQPRLVILDEPTSALDPVGRRDIREVIASLRDQGITVFLNSHLLSEVELVCDRVAILHQGRVVREGRLADLLRAETVLHLTVDAVTDALLDVIRPLARTVRANGRSIDVELADPDAVPAVARAAQAAGAELWELRPRQTTLEDVFIGVVRPKE
jgi:ABC-2 type transport system ATP-binding protein